MAQAEAEIVARYGGLDDGELGLTAAMFDPPTGAFVVARRGGAAGPPVGGVGVRALRPGRRRRSGASGSTPTWRGQGVARALMAAIEDAARDLGLTALRLGTGDRQPEAVALYASGGWERRPRRPTTAARYRPATSGSPSSSARRVMDAPFELVCEIEPATTPDLTRVRHQIGVLSPVATTFLIPDNHIGRATVSSVAVAHEVQPMGGRSIACLNARDRNLLGFRRDLLTAAAYGVDQFLFVYGDEPLGRRAHQRAQRAHHAARGPRLRGGPRWTAHADALRRGHRAAAPAGVEAGGRLPLRADRLLASTTCWPGGPRSRSTSPSTPGSSWWRAPAWPATSPSRASPSRPTSWQRLEKDRNAGVDAACDLVVGLRDSGAFDGVHLIPVARYREVAARLERVLSSH